VHRPLSQSASLGECSPSVGSYREACIKETPNEEVEGQKKAMC
jgi:hypothetical protein